LCARADPAYNMHIARLEAQMSRNALITGFLSVALLGGSAFADHGRGHDREHDRREHEHHAIADRDHDRRPAGWDHGRKTGWHGHDVPPGQAKKAEARHEAWRDREHREHEARERAHGAHANDARKRHEAWEARERGHNEHAAASQHRRDEWRAREHHAREHRTEWQRRHHHQPPATTAQAPTPTATAQNTPGNRAPITGQRWPTRAGN
jgi:hypothetical protein